MDVEVIKCKNCGGSINLNNAQGGVVECEYCGSFFTLPKTETNPEALSFLRQGEHDLDTCKFDDAYTAYQKAAEYDASEPEAYFGMALAEFKVQYIKDTVNNRLQPICHLVTDKVFTDGKQYKNALKCASPNQKAAYEKKAKEIDYIRNEFLKLKQSGADYDCFICTKVTRENGEHTEDSHIATKLYNELKRAGYAPFYSEEEVRGRAGADYEALILYALYRAGCMIVVCCDESYLQTPWVKNEYTRYLSLLADGEKENESITIVYKGAPIEKLPGKSGKIEGINYGEGDALLRILGFAEKFKTAFVPEIHRKEYKGASYTKKNAKREGVTKRQLEAVSGGEITVSARAQMNIAAEFLARKDFSQAVRQCDVILNANPANSETHWMRFLAQHRSVDSRAYVHDYAGKSDFEHLEKAIASCSDVAKTQQMYKMLYDRVEEKEDIEAYKEYIILPDSSESDISKLTNTMYNCAMQRGDAGIFREIIKTVTDTDKYIYMNLAFAEKISPQAAVEFYQNVLSADEGSGEALYKVFAAEHGLTDAAVFAYCSKSEHFKDIEDSLFAYGYNEYATKAFFKLCLANVSDSPQDSSNLASFVFSMIPKTSNKTFMRLVQEYTDALIAGGKMEYAKKYNEMLLAADSFSDDAYFNRVLIKNGFKNPLELVKIADTLMDDADFFSAINSYTEKHPNDKNLYLDINYAVKELREILHTARRRAYVTKTVRVDKKGLLSCKEEVKSAAETADHSGLQFSVKESIKTVITCIPTIVLLLLSLTVVRAPELVNKAYYDGVAFAKTFNVGRMVLGFFVGGAVLAVTSGISAKARKGVVKAILLSIPAIAIGAVFFLSVRSIVSINVDLGLLIDVLALGLAAQIVAGVLTADRAYGKDEFLRPHIRQRSAIMLTGAAVYAIVMVLGIILLYRPL